MLHYPYISYQHISYILLTLFVLEYIDMPFVKDNALVAAASEKIQNQTFWENFEYVHICTHTSPKETQT